MPGNLFTPVTIRRRSAAQGCANAHTDAAAPAVGRGSIESTSTSGKIRRLTGDYEADKRVKIS